MKFTMSAVLATVLLSTSVSALALPHPNEAVHPRAVPGDNEIPTRPGAQPIGPEENPGGDSGPLRPIPGETSMKPGANPPGGFSLEGRPKARRFGQQNPGGKSIPQNLPQTTPGSTYETPKKPDGQRMGPGGNGGGESLQKPGGGETSTKPGVNPL